MIIALSIIGVIGAVYTVLSYFTAKEVIEEQHPRVDNHGNSDN